MDKTEKFWKIFERTMGNVPDRACHTVASVEAWDSLTHIELIFEMENILDIEFGQEDISKLYSNTDVIIEFIQRKV